MRILAAGGGSGGHVSPVVAVINEIAKQTASDDLEVLFVCDRAFEVQARGLMEQGASVPVEVTTIMAGKFRRYSHLTKLRQLLMPQIVWANFRDIFKVAVGFLQSLWLIGRFRPDVLFAKGGYVCLPVGMAAKLMRVPIVVHDSDTRPGLTNKILSRWASAIATGSPLENYRYPATISSYVGVPIASEFRPFSEEEQRAAKRRLGFDERRPLVVATGGGLGAASINTALMKSALDLMKDDLQLYHVTGRAHYDEVVALAPKSDEYKIVPFVYERMAEILGAADIVISRASATFIQELAGLKKAAILVPSRALGDQRKNAEVYKAADAAVVLTDDELGVDRKLTMEIQGLIADVGRREKLAARLHSFARPDAARDVANIVIDQLAVRSKKNSSK